MTDKLTNLGSDERGMTGIGVLILFIALVLVAAIASGLILDTAGVLQNKAQNTGEQSTSEVSDRLSVLSTSGDVAESDNLNSTFTGTFSSVDTTTTPTVGTFNVTSGEKVHKAEFTDAVAADGSDTITVELYNETGSTVTATDTISVDSEADDYVAEFSTSDLGAETEYSIRLNGNSNDFTADVEAFASDGEANKVTELSTTVYRSPGAGDVDLQHATVEFFSPDGTAFLIHEDEYNALSASEIENDFSESLGSFGTVAIKDDDSSIPVLNSRDDRASIDVGLYHSPSGAVNGEPAALDYLWEGESATLRITTQHGATTTEIVNVPESLAGYDGSTVML